MDDGSFFYGAPARGRLRRSAGRPRRAGRTPAGSGARARARVRLPVIALALAVAGAGVFAYLKFVSAAGNEIAETQKTVVRQIDRAKDAQAQATAQQVLVTAKTVYAETGSYTEVTPGKLTDAHPSFTYTDGPAAGPKIVSVATTESAFAAAVFSSSGRCLYVKDDVEAGTTYGSGSDCTGAAAMSHASAPSW